MRGRALNLKMRGGALVSLQQTAVPPVPFKMVKCGLGRQRFATYTHAVSSGKVSGRENSNETSSSSTDFLEDASPATATSEEVALRISRLDNPIKLKVSGKMATKISEPECVIAMSSKGQPQDVSLNAYMSLPIEQYVLFEGIEVTRTSDTEFRFTGPRLDFLKMAWIQPIMEVVGVVTPNENVKLTSDKFYLIGSDFVKRTRFNDRVAVYYDTKMTWHSRGPVPLAELESFKSGETESVGPEETGSRSDNKRSPKDAVPSGEIFVEVNMDVWSEVVGPFKVVNRDALQKISQAAVKPFIKPLLRAFSSQLEKDYKKWCTDAEYRQQRVDDAAAKRAQRAAANQPSAQSNGAPDLP